MTELPPLRVGRPRVETGHVTPIPELSIPFAVIEGARPGPRLLVTAGVHGSEFCSIEAALRLARTPPDSFGGTLLVLPALNVRGFRERAIYMMPEDGRNLNRMFPGDPAGSVSQRLAHWLVGGVFSHVDAYLDLHGGDLDEELAPFSLFPAGSEPSRELAAAFGLPIAVAAGGEGYTINAAHRVGVPAIIAEVGGNGLWDEGGVATLSAGIDRVMRHLGMRDGPVAAPRSRVVAMWVPAAPSDGLWYPAARVGDAVAAGDPLGEVRALFGAVLATVRSERAGVVLYRLTSLSVNAGEALLGIGTPLAEPLPPGRG